MGNEQLPELTGEYLCRHFDHMDPAVSADLSGVYKTLRDECPVTKTDAHGSFWAISRYDDLIRAALNHRELNSGGGVAIPPIGNPLPGLPTESDEPEHKAYRGVIWPFLTPGAVKRHADGIRALTNELIDDIIESGEVDLVPTLAEPLPIRAAGLALGFTEAEGTRFYDYFRDMVEATNRGDVEAATAAGGAFVGFLSEVLAEVTANPRDDSVVTAISTAAYDDGQPFEDHERIGLLLTTAAAAVETTTHAIAHSLNRIAEPRIKQRLIDDPELIPSAVDEALRIDSPNNMMARTVATTMEFGGEKLEEGDRALLLYGSGNLDERAFPDPNTFVVDRSPNRHLAFGWGIHKCAGQHFARLEMGIVIEEVLRRMPDYQVVGEAPPARMKGGLFWSLDSLPVRFTPGPREA